MAVKTFYFKNAVPAGATLHRSLQDGGTAPTTAVTTTGWNSGTNAVAQSCLMVGGTEVARNAGTWGTTLQPSAAPSTTLGDCWRSENTLNGTFANANWVFNFGMRSVTAAYTGRFRLAVRIWRSANADGSSATELTAGRVVSSITAASLTTTADTTITVTWTPGATKALSNEYLFVNVGIEITTIGGGTTQDMDFSVGSAFTLVTPNLAQTFSDSVVEGLVTTGADTPSAIATYPATVAEGTAGTAADTVGAGVTRSASVLEGPINQVAASEDFTSASWGRSNVTVTANATTDPIGGSTADKITPAAITSTFFVNQTLPNLLEPNLDYFQSIYAKAGGYNWLKIRAFDKGFDTANVWFNLATGAVGTVSADMTVVTAISDAGNGWWRCSVGFNSITGSENARVEFSVADADNHSLFTANGSNAIYLWGAQLQANALTAYQPSGLPFAFDTAGAGTTYNVSVNEGNRNLFARTEEIGSSPWASFFCSSSSNVNTDPLGGSTADKLIPTTNNSNHNVSIFVSDLAPSTNYTASIYAKASGYSTLLISALTRAGTETTPVSFNLSAGTSAAGGAIEDVGNGWYRCSITFNSLTGANDTCIAKFHINSASPYAGNAVSGILFWGGQFEMGALTAYQPVSGFEPPAAIDTTDARTTAAASVGEGNRNLLHHTESLDDATAWPATRATVTANAVVAPDGATTADLLVGTTPSINGQFLQQSPVLEVASTTYTISAFIKSGGSGIGGNTFNLAIADLSSSVVNQFGAYDLRDLSAVVNAGTGTAGIYAVGSGWYRVWRTFNSATGTPGAKPARLLPTYDTGTNGVYVWGAQLEVGVLSAYYPVPGAATPALDTVAAGLAVAASVAEGGSTAADTTNGALVGTRVGQVSWVRFFAPASAGTLFTAAVAEGSASAVDTSSAQLAAVAAVAEGSASATDAPSVRSVAVASVAEGSATAVDAPSVKATDAATVTEGAATALDTTSATSIWRPAVVEGSATAQDTPSAIEVEVATVAEGSASAVDTPSAKAVLAATVAEGGNTATDTPIAAATTAAAVAEGTATAIDTPSAVILGATSAVAEGANTAADSQSARAVWVAVVVEAGNALDAPSALEVAVATVAEGAATALDTQSASTFGVFAASVAEGAATALDTQSTTAVAAAAVAEAGSGADAPSATAILKASVAEGGATAQDTTDASRFGVLTAAVVEGGATANDACDAVIVRSGSIAEGTASAQDTVAAAAVWAAFIGEGSGTAQDTPSARAIFRPAVVEGASTAADTVSSGGAVVAAVAEGAPTAVDTLVAELHALFTAVIAEGSATAIDTVDGRVSGAAIPCADDAYLIEAEDRTYRVPIEMRVVQEVPPEDRAYRIPAESRTMLVEPEDRVWIIPRDRGVR